MPVTFPVTPGLQLGQADTYSTLGPIEAVMGIAKAPPEAVGSNTSDRLIGEAKFSRMHPNGFFRAVHESFAHHFPLVLSPDDVWLAIAQGFANHVTQNAEKLRSKFVSHSGKALIRIERDNFRKGDPDNDWPGVFNEFSARIAEHVGEHQQRLVVSNFSTTGALEKTVSEVVFMDTLKSYFDYRMRTRCGIPEITLLGTQDDWAAIEDRARVLAEYEAKDWSASLVGVLSHFKEAFKGNANPKFWQSLYKEGGGSGGPYVTGALNVFFPYVLNYQEELTPNEAALAWEKTIKTGHFGGGGPTSGEIPKGLSQVPFIWEYYGTDIPMNFLGGFIGTSQESSGALRPAIGWAVADSVSASGS